VAVEHDDVIGDRQLVDLVEADAAPGQRAGERPGVTGDDPSRSRMRVPVMFTNSASSVKIAPTASASFAFRAAWYASTISRGCATAVIAAG
jgi:hypothetical protein